MTQLSVETLTVLGAHIAKLRKQRGFSQEKFAEECDLHRTAMGLIERGKSIPRLDTLLAVSSGLNISVSELLICLSGKEFSATP